MNPSVFSVSANGSTVVVQGGIVSPGDVSKVATGAYRVIFRSVCDVGHSVALVSLAENLSGSVTARINGNSIDVFTFDAKGVAADRAFSMAAFLTF